MARKNHLDETGNQGRIYELELLMLFFQKAYHRKMQFNLGREVQDAGKFDDLVFRYKDNGAAYCRYLQAKHCLHEDDRITSKVLFPSRYDKRNNLAEKFHLDKYLRSFIAIKNNHNIKKLGILKDLVIFTNVDFDYDDLRVNGIETQTITDDFMDFSTPQKEAKLFRIKADPNSPLCSRLKDCSDCFVLASEIILQVQQAFDNSPNRKLVLLGGKDSASKEYARVLLAEVLRKTNDKITFQEAFVQGSSQLTEKAAIFRTKLLNIAQERCNFRKEEFLEKAAVAVLAGTKVFGQKSETEFKQLPTEELTNRDVTEFLGYLIFAVNQPNAVQLKTFIGDQELKESFGCIDTDFIAESLENKILNWIKERKSEEGWIDNTHGEIFFQKANKMIVSSICLPFVASFLDVSDVKPKEAINEFLTSNTTCLVVASKETFLTCCRLYKMVKEESPIFASSSMIKKTETRQKIVDGFIRTRIKLLVIECRERLDGHILNDLFLATSKAKKKLILVAPHNSPPCFPGASRCTLITAEEITFKHFTLESRTRVLENEVDFQGYQVKLKNLVDANEPDRVARILNSRTISRLVRDQENVKIGKPLQKQKDFEEEYYINRVFLNKREVIRKVVDMTTAIEEDGKPQHLHPGSDHHPPREENDTGVHEIVEIVTDEVPEEELLLSTQRLIIISDTAGMGKSTVLTSLSNRFKRKYPYKWVQRVNLNDHTSNLVKNKKAKIDSGEEAIRFFWKVFLETKQEEDELELEMYNYYLERKEKDMVVFFDGLDEVCPDYKDVVLKLIQVLFERTEIGKIVVSTRPNMKTDLEYSLNMPAYSMEPFTVKQQVDFLTAFWQTRNPKLIAGDRVRKYAESLINTLNQSIDDDQRKLTGIPLQSQMVAEIFEKRKVEGSDDYEFENGEQISVSCSLEEYYYSTSKDPPVPRNIHLSTLFTLFVRIKYWNILESRKRQTDCSKPGMRERARGSYQEFLNDYKLLALSTLLPRRYKTVLDSSQMKRIDSIVNAIKTGKDKNGLVDEIVDGRPQFLHRTFAEYFFVELLTEYLQSEDYPKGILRLIKRFGSVASDNREIINADNYRKFDAFFFQSVLIKDDYQTVRQFFESKVGMIIRKIRKTPDIALLYRPIRASKNSAVHVAAAANHTNIVRFLIVCFGERIKNVLEYRNINGKEVIEIAASKGNLALVRWAVSKGVKIRTKTDLLPVAAENGSSRVMEYLLSEYSKQDLLPFQNLAVNRRNLSGFTPLDLAAKSGHLETVRILCSFGADINNRDDNVSMPLMLAALEGNHEIVVYLAENGANLHAKIKDFCIFRISLISGRVETVEYLLSKGFDIHAENAHGNYALHVACSSGAHEMVRFLLARGADVHKKDKQGNSPLLYASYFGNVEAVELLLHHGADIHDRNDAGFTALLTAALGGQHDLLLYLIENGANLEDTNYMGTNVFGLALGANNLKTVRYLMPKGFDIHEDNNKALHFACKGGKEDVIRFLLTEGVNVNMKNDDGSTPLHYASFFGDVKIVEMLLQHGSDVHARDDHDVTPLLRSAAAGKTDIMINLLENGANLDDTTTFYQPPRGIFEIALQEGNLETVKYLMSKGFDIHQEIKLGQQALHIASKGGKDETVRFLLEKGADIHKKDLYGLTPSFHAVVFGNARTVEVLLRHGVGNLDEILQIAAAASKTDILVHLMENESFPASAKNLRIQFQSTFGSANLETVKYLISKGFDIHEEDNLGQQALHYASRAGNDKTVRFLLREGAEIHKKDLNGSTPLLHASRSGHVDTVDILLQHGANIHDKDHNGVTALLFAAKADNSDLLIHLLDKGASLYDKTPDGISVFIVALQVGNLETVKYLMSKGFDIPGEGNPRQQALHYASAGGKYETVRFLLQGGADIQTKNHFGTTPLHIASEYGNLETVEVLLEHGADIHSKDNEGVTPLLLAAAANKHDILVCLIENGASLLDTTKSSENVFHLAWKFGTLDTIEYLLQKGFDIQEENNFGQQALHFACAREQYNTVLFLLENGADVNKKDAWGNTPLWIASQRGNNEIEKILFRHGARLSLAVKVAAAATIATAAAALAVLVYGCKWVFSRIR